MASILKAEAVVKAPVLLTLEVAISPLTDLLPLEVQPKSSAATKAVAAQVASKGVHPIATSKAIQKLLTFTRKVIVG